VSLKNNKKLSGKQIVVMNKNKNCPYRKVLLRYLEESDKKMDLIEYDNLEPVIKSFQNINSISVPSQTLISSNMKKVALPKEMSSIRVNFVVNKSNQQKASLKRIIRLLKTNN
ncbi:hypothetical protein, partial [Oenococcus oeni]|uniref:hypothetical protein n=1 Tax=Oenococcus oeni TaxID=1247 RepID=UPI001C90437B